MKFIRPIIFFLLSVLVVTTILSLVMPTQQKVERTVTINAPAALIYQQLTRLEKFNSFSVWSRRDSSVKYTMTGTDGTVGASTSWKGDPDISGEGKIEIISLEENKSIRHKLSFTKPKKGRAESTFTLKESNGTTSVTWNFDLATPRPSNIFNLFFSLDKNMGTDFEEGLATLKTAIETINGKAVSKSFDVQTMNFPATRFAAIRQTVQWGDLISFFAQHLPILYDEAVKANGSPGIASGLIYKWDEKNQRADIAAALPVSREAKIQTNIINTVNIEASKAVFVNFSGAYDQLPGAYYSIRKYIAENKLEEKTPSIEQYISGPANEKDSSKWLTKIVFLVK